MITPAERMFPAGDPVSPNAHTVGATTHHRLCPWRFLRRALSILCDSLPKAVAAISASPVTIATIVRDSVVARSAPQLQCSGRGHSRAVSAQDAPLRDP